MEKLLSIIIPTYNMSLYIERCMNSLISSKTIEKLDIIVVNDGSKDDSSEKAKNIAISYPNSIRVIDKGNGNYGSCINTGLKLAKGKYIKILDADDLFDTHNLENVLDIIKELDVDMILTDFKMAYSNGKSKLISFNVEPNQVLTFTAVCTSKDFTHLWMHSVMYKTSIVQNINYHQTEGISYTDQEWIFTPLAYVRNIFYIHKVLYLYSLGRVGQTVSTDYLTRNFHHHVICVKNIIKCFCNLPTDIPNPITQLLYTRIFNLTKFIYKGYLLKKYPDEDNVLRDFDSYLKVNLPKLYANLKNIKLSKPIIPYHYIRHWQKNPNSKVLYYMIKLYILKKHLI